MDQHYIGTRAKISVVIPTRDRQKDLAELLPTLLNQSYPANEIIIVNDSVSSSIKEIVNLFATSFKSIGSTLISVQGSGEGLTAAKNLGVKIAQGDALLFLDDDVLLDRNVLMLLDIFLTNHPEALGVQPAIRETATYNGIENAISKALMLSYSMKNTLRVRRSGTNIFPRPFTREISTQRLAGVACYRNNVFKRLSFDMNLKRWGFMEDLDFSYRLYKKKPNSLYAIPDAIIIHKNSIEARLQPEQKIFMMIIYWFYIFFKNLFNASLLNLIAFLWALTGNFISAIGAVIIKRKSTQHLVYLIKSYLIAFRNLRNILMRDLDFLNKNLVRALS